ncbi:efflux RND transporter periplasmic adaptor subunit [Sphingomonas astaxanthinifaciens]|uniref:MexE family multidrug efflux RND transporter periplasmic adaptor subunit n=1 Tax=Sphingomonas astaxanthinifaciens DSM 22298 TaxID=1123267 RepID=A0ABQ5Z695_9SPHN|nr:MexE family multidrug efflux RND transporter periplasmic adaptor subunit [Sphingomonas astaxanthinifaciens DSM 22298]
MNVATTIKSDEATPLALSRRGLTRGQKILLGVLPIAVAGGLYFANAQGGPADAAPPPATVTAAAPVVRQITEWDDYSGRFEASRSVEVRPRVSGAITGVHFQDGAYVRQGQLLFTIDARPFAAALAEAQAAVQSARSDLSLASADLGRATRLLEVDAVSRSDVDRLRARVQAAQAALAAAQARVRSRALDLSFTQVRAPISGRISDRRIDAGNLVAGGIGAGEATLLTTINALDPVYFTFDASEALYLKARRARESGAGSSEVAIRLQDERDYKWRGRLDFTDNGIDGRSGTIRLRAVIANPTGFLTPGMFGNARLASGAATMALMVPDEAVQTDQARKVVTVVASDGSLSPRPVTVGPLLDGLRVIRSGLSPNDRVVIAGAQLAMPGAKVKVKPGVIQPRPATAAPAAPSQPAGEATFTAR